jgi:hypothetical protein
MHRGDSLGRQVEMLPFVSKMMFWCLLGACRKRESVERGASFVLGAMWTTYPHYPNGIKCFVGG